MRGGEGVWMFGDSLGVIVWFLLLKFIGDVKNIR